MHRPLAVLIVCVLLADVAVLATGAAQPAARGVTSLNPTDDPPPPPAGQIEIAGTVTAADFVAQETSPLATPLTIEVPSPGAGGAAVRSVTSDGAETAVIWGGGRPLVLSGEGGALLLGAPIRAELTADSIIWHLDGGVHGLQPGSYRIDSPVAVGAGSLATPRDSVTFDATDSSTVQTDGDATVRFGARPFTVVGPGALHLVGQLRVRDSVAIRSTTRVEMTNGSFTLSLIPGATEWTITATVNGPLVIDAPAAS